MTYTVENELSFTVNGMPVTVKTKDKLTGRQRAKIDDKGQAITRCVLLPKARARFRMQGSQVHTYTPKDNEDFEAWIRKACFAKYPTNNAVARGREFWGVHKQLLGCAEYSQDVSDTGCRKHLVGVDFSECKKCKYRRKNLGLDLKVYLADDRHIDLDNLIKIVLDALNKVCFYDDGQIVVKHAELYTNSSTEQMQVRLFSIPEVVNACWDSGTYSFSGLYNVKNLAQGDAQNYVSKLLGTMTNLHIRQQFIDYIKRVDTRSYITKLKA